MGLKIYKSSSGQVIAGYIKVDGKNTFLALNNFDKTFRTNDTKLQEAIENSDFFTGGKIFISFSDDVKNSTIAKNIEKEIKEFPGITDINDVVSILRKDPYRISYKKLKSPEEIKEQIKVNNLSFPDFIS